MTLKRSLDHFHYPCRLTALANRSALDLLTLNLAKCFVSGGDLHDGYRFHLLYKGERSRDEDEDG